MSVNEVQAETRDAGGKKQKNLHLLVKLQLTKTSFLSLNGSTPLMVYEQPVTLSGFVQNLSNAVTSPVV